MEIKTELISNGIVDIVRQRLKYMEIDADKIADSYAIKALDEIKSILKNEELSDFETVDKIVDVFNKYHIDTGNKYDF